LTLSPNARENENVEMRAEFEDEHLEIETGRRRPNLKILAIVLAAILPVGYTLAANIGISSNGSTEFGQGVQVTSACDPDISLKPTATFRNEVSVQDNYVSKIDLAGISQRCQGKLFIVRAYGETGTPLWLGPVRFPVIKFAMNGSSWKNYDAGCNQIDPYSNSQNGEDSYIRLKMDDCPLWYSTGFGPDGRPLHSSEVYRFTVESRENTMVRVDINSTYGNGQNIGWTHQSEEGYAATYLSGGSNVPIFFDKALQPYFEVYIKLSSSDFSNNSVGPGLVTLTTSPTIRCSYVDKTPMNSPIASGPFMGRGSPGIDAVRFGCYTTGDGTVTAS
jgi:hypothetical protein